MKNEHLKDFMVRFAMVENNKEEGEIREYATRFGFFDEEGNFLYFCYHVLDIANAIVNGSVKMFNLPEFKNSHFENHKYIYHTKEFLQEYLSYLGEEVKSYNEYKKQMNEEVNKLKT